MTSSSPPPSHSHPLPFLFTSTSPPPTLLSQGAEALLYRTHYLIPHTPSVLKYRPRKPYRHPILDARLTRHRILGEARTLVKCRREGVPVPGVLGLDADGSTAPPTKEARHEGGNDTNASKQGEREGEGGRKGEGKGEGGWMMLEFIEGLTIREVLQGRRVRSNGQDTTKTSELGKRAEAEDLEKNEKREVEEQDREKTLMRKIGLAVGHLHSIGVIHGDLTTSNMILRPPPSSAPSLSPPSPISTNSTTLAPVPPNPNLNREESSLDGDIILIDFGLSTQSLQDEDKAVDLYVLERAFTSTHPGFEGEAGFGQVLEAYGGSYKGAKRVLARLEEVRQRGRKRSMVG